MNPAARINTESTPGLNQSNLAQRGRN